MSPLPAVDACPGLLVLHEARDGHVARIRLPGGYVTAARWRVLAQLADRFGDGRLDLTARGNIQLRGIRAGEGDALARAAAAAGLLPSAAHDRARNIMASPLAGLGGRPPLRRLVRELDAALLSSPGLAALPGRFLFAVDDGTGGSGLDGCDIGLLHRADGDAELVVADRLTGVRIGSSGVRGGSSGVRGGSSGVRIGPTGVGAGEAGVRADAGAAASIVAAAARAAVAAGVGRDVSRIAGLADGGQAVAAAVGGILGPAAQPGRDVRLPLDAPGAAVASGVGRVLVAAARLGRLTSAQALLVAGLLRRGEVARIAIAGRLVIPVSTSREAALGRLADAGLLVAAADPLADVTACSGAACAKSAADVRAVARPLATHPRTHWVGCTRRCGCPPDAEPVIAAGAGSYLLPGTTKPVPLAALDGVPCLA